MHDIIRFTFSLSVAIENNQAVMERCQDWANEITRGMQEHHFAADDIPGARALAAWETDPAQGLFAKWTPKIETVTAEAAEQMSEPDQARVTRSGRSQ